jgi:hypothetical protein
MDDDDDFTKKALVHDVSNGQRVKWSALRCSDAYCRKILTATPFVRAGVLGDKYGREPYCSEGCARSTESWIDYRTS